MGKAYLKYEQIAGFGVVVSSAVTVSQVCHGGSAPLIACAAVDALVIWNVRTGESVVRFGNAATRKAGAISAIAVSAAGETIACGYTDGSIRLWSFSARDTLVSSIFGEDEPQPFLTFNGHRSGVSALAFESVRHGTKLVPGVAPSVLVSGSNDGDIIYWSVVEATGLFRISAHTDAVTSVLLFCRDQSFYIISASKDALVKVFDAESQHCIQTLAQSRAEVWAMQMDPTINFLFTASVGTEIRLYSLFDSSTSSRGNGCSGTTVNDLLSFDKESIFQYLGYTQRSIATDRVSSVACTTHCGERYIVICATDKTAEIFRMRDAKQAEVHRKRREKRKYASVEKEARATGEDEGWDADKIEKHIAEQMQSLNFTLDAIDFMVSVRHLKMRKKLRSILFLASSTYIPVDKRGGVELQLLIQQKDNALEIHSASITSGGKNRKRKRTEGYASGEDRTASDIDKPVDELKKLVTLDFAGHRNDVRSLSLSPDESTILSTSDGALKLWNVATQKCIRTMKFTGYGLCTQYLGADGMIGVVGTKSGKLQVYELGSGSLITEENAHQGEVWSICIDDDMYDAKFLITGGADKRVCFWGIDDVLVGKSGKLELSRVLEMPDQVLCVSVASGRERRVVLISMLDSTVRSYFLDTLEPYLNFYGHRLPVMTMDVSSDGSILVTGSADKTIKLWGMDFGDCRRSLRAHADSVLSVAFQPKTHYFFSGSRDGSLKYWDADNFEFICEIEGQRGEVWSMTLSGDGEIVATASHDRMIRIWRRTDEPLFLDEEKDRRMEELFESKLIDNDIFEASKAKKDNVGFMEDATKAESSTAGKRSMDTVKGGEALLEALQLCEEENVRLADNSNETPNLMMLGLSPEAYMLRALEQIKSADLEEALHILPLDGAVRLLEHLAKLLAPEKRSTRLAVEMLTRSALYLIKLHHNQICAGAASRKLISELYEYMQVQVEGVRQRLGVNCAALHFWRNELLDRDDAPFRDASARAYNIEVGKRDKAKETLRKQNFSIHGSEMTTKSVVDPN